MKFLPLTLALLLASTPILADDGEQQIRNVSKTPDLDTEHASLQQMWFNVPVQSTGDDDIESILYIPKDGVDALDFVTERVYARPLIALYQDGHVDLIDEDAGGFFGHGEREMYAALSLDDGDTWRDRNLSLSADMSSIVVDGEAYPGDVYRNFTALAGNKVLAVWGSRYCSSGNPTYSMEIDEIEAIFDSEYVDVSHLGDVDACTDDDVDGVGPDDEPTICTYFEDYWHVSGSQGIQDFADVGYPAAGKVPYGCLWAARGTLELLDDDDEEYGIVWRQAERLSSGVRDVNRIEAACVGGAGCVITWQEDPEGLRPGEGEGPGEGWSGAIAHHETDIWYSYVDMDNFDLVKEDEDDEIMPIADWLESEEDGVPKVGVPFSIPVRITDNAMCQTPEIGEQADDPYCYMDFDETGTADFCAEDVPYDIEVPDEDGEAVDHTVSMCIAENGRLMRGNTASTRTRTNLRGYDSTADADEGTDSGWVILAYEESKGLGEEDDEDPDKIDMGKNIWYHTFDMFNPEMVSQGMILNQPAIYIDDLLDTSDLIGYDLVEEDASDYTDYDGDVSFRTIEPDPIYDAAGLDDDDVVLYQTEIARRYSQITQPASWAGESGMVALTMWKQGIVRQGGPADVFARRFLIPDTFDTGADNPFDYANMECDEVQFADGTNPRYVKGLCMSSPQNLSGTTLVDCEDGVDNCEAVDFPYDDLLADIDKSIVPGNLPKTTEWRQCQEENQSFSVISSGDVTSFTCDDSDLNDQSWENPWDLSKGHRGFIYGDFIVQMYAWSPNWEANSLGHDNYNLYVRRSFDGGASWTTLPSTSISLPEGAVIPDTVVADGSMSCEWYGIPGSETEYPACFTYAAGEYEQARNLSQLIGTHVTVLDPRFAGTDPAFLGDLTKMMVDGELVENAEVLYPDDAVNPSVFFATFEEGDTAPIMLGEEGDPMDMYYSRAINFGDEYELADTNADGIADVDATDGEFEIFDKLEWHELQAAEAALKSNPGGTLFYAIWNQFLEVDAVEEGVHGTILLQSDAIVRRTMELGDDGVTLPSGGDGDGGPGPGGEGGEGGDDDPGPGDERPGNGSGGGRDNGDRPDADDLSLLMVISAVDDSDDTVEPPDAGDGRPGDGSGGGRDNGVNPTPGDDPENENGRPGQGSGGGRDNGDRPGEGGSDD
ncbi:MAG: choice-of-anchor O protein [Pseudomonadota bacterium]